MKKNKIICLFLTLVLALTVSTQSVCFTAFAESTSTSLILGDSNLDFTVNVKDVTNIQKSVAKIIDLGDIAQASADVDGNDEINVKDATAIQKWVANIDVSYFIGELFDYVNEIISEGGFILLNINPEIRIGFNADGNVTTVSAENKDAEALIKDFSDYQGKSCKEVVDRLLTLVKEAGYLVDEVDGENKLVVIQLEAGCKAPKEGFLEELRKHAEENVKDLDVKPEFIKIEDKDYDKKYATDDEVSEFITLDKAVEIALAYSGVWAEDAVFEEKEYDIDHGTPYYELEFSANGFEFECKVNALNGKVVDFEKEKCDNHNRRPNGTPDEIKPSKPVKPATADEFITLDEAKEIALKDAGVNAEDAKFKDRNLDLEDGTPYYEIEFEASGFEYEYEIHAVSGKIIESECEPVDDDRDDFDEDSRKPRPTEPVESKPAQEEKPAPEKPVKTEPAETEIHTSPVFDVENAKDEAIKHAGISKDKVKFDKAELDREGGKHIFEIEFEASGFEYEYEIDAENGKIINHEKERADD